MELDDLATGWLSLPELSEQIDLPLQKIRQLVREGKLVTVPHGPNKAQSVPSDIVRDGHLVKGLAGALTVLRDAGFSDVEALRWLLTEDSALSARPVDFMAEGRDSAVKRRAQVLAF